MIYNTRDFGEIEVSDNDIIEFVQPLFGFEEYKKYTFIFSDSAGSHIVWLQSLEDASICFILIDPSGFSPEYTPTISSGIEKLLGDGTLECWVVCVIPENAKNITANLKSPVILNSDTNCAAQTILEQDYPVKFFLMRGEG